MSQMNKMNHFGASHIYGQLLQVADAAEARLRFFSRVQPCSAAYILCFEGFAGLEIRWKCNYE